MLASSISGYTLINFSNNDKSMRLSEIINPKENTSWDGDTKANSEIKGSTPVNCKPTLIAYDVIRVMINMICAIIGIDAKLDNNSE